MGKAGVEEKGVGEGVENIGGGEAEKVRGFWEWEKELEDERALGGVFCLSFSSISFSFSFVLLSSFSFPFSFSFFFSFFPVITCND